MARSRFDFSVVVSVLVLLQAVTPGPASAIDNASPGPLPVAISAEFNHSSQIGMYRTAVSSVVPVVFATDATGAMAARFGTKQADCFGLASWVPPDNGSEAIGPAVLCVANAIVSEQEYNDWVHRNGRVKVDPGLVIPLGPPQPVEPIQPGQIPAQTRLNVDRVVVQAFVSGCGTESFRKYGDLVFEKSTLAFKFWTDTRGRPQVELAASVAVLQNLNGDTWFLVREGCDAQQALPSAPSDGFSISFAGSSVTPLPNPAMLSGQMGLVVGEIESLLLQQRLESKAGKSLLRQLGDAGTSLQRANVDQAVHTMQKFRDSLASLGKRGLIDPAAAASLAKGALGIEAFLTGHASLRLPPLDPALYCSANGATCPDTVPSCKFTSWYVDGASGDAAPDGSPKHSFSSITEALAQAGKAKLCGVNLHVAPARYVGPLEITRHTRIIGPSSPISTDTFPSTIIEGSVSNHGPYLLEISNITLSWFHEDVANGVFVDHPCAKTSLQNVAVLGYRGFGVRQRGGSLLARRTIVANTQAYPEFLFQGTGMLLSCGVQASLHDIVLDSNESAGLLIAHPGTMVDALGLVVGGTRIHPSLAGFSGFYDPTLTYGGAVQVRHQARFNATSSHISENWLGGVVVDTGGVALFDWGTISQTVRVPDRLFPEWPFGFGGTNAVAAREGQLTLSNIISTRAALCGVQVALAGELDLWGDFWGDSLSEISSQVTRSEIGACVGIPGYLLSRLNRMTAYVDNGDTIQATVDFPAPAPSLPDGL